MLIGVDHYRDIVGDKVIRGNGPTAVYSKLGYLLSGPTNKASTNQDTTFSVTKVLSSHKEEVCDIEKFWNLESLGIKHKEENSQMDKWTTTWKTSKSLVYTLKMADMLQNYHGRRTMRIYPRMNSLLKNARKMLSSDLPKNRFC
jgi:hypothetical protein